MTSLHLSFDASLSDLYHSNANYASDAGYNLIFPQDISLQCGESRRIELQLTARMLQDQQSSAYLIYPRSSIANSSIRMASVPTIIEANHQGSLSIVVDCLQDCLLKRGTSFFQICQPSLLPFSTLLERQ